MTSMMTQSSALPRRRGRRPVPTIAAERAKHLRVAAARFIEGLSIAKVASRFDCSPRTVIYWTHLALTYPEGQALRELKSA